MLTYQFSKALRVLHADQNSKVVHRDIELDNIFVEVYDGKTGNIRVRLADFELCEVVDVSRITNTNILSGDKITDFHRDFKKQSEIDQIVLEGVYKKLPNSDLKWAIISCLQIDKDKRINSRILMEYLLRIILVEDRFDESTNADLLALKLIFKKINFAEGKKLLSESSQSMSQEELELIPLFNIFSTDLTIEKINSIPDRSDSFFIPFMKSVLFLNLNIHEIAIHYLTELISLYPFFVNLYNSRGVVFRKIKEYLKSIEDHSKAIKLDPNNYKYYYHRGIIFRKMKKYLKSIEDHSKAIKLDPNNATVQSRIMRSHVIFKKLRIISDLFYQKSNFLVNSDTILFNI